MYSLLEPAYAVAAHVVVFDVTHKAFVGIHPVNGDLLNEPPSLALIAHGNGDFDEFFADSGKVGVKAQPFIVGVSGVIGKDALFDFFRNRFNIVSIHNFSPQCNFIAEFFVE